MGKKRTTTVTEEMLNPNGDEEQAPPLLESSEEIENFLAIEDFVTSFGTNVQKVRVYRLDKNGDISFCGEYAPGLASDATIQDEFGGGKYVVKLVNAQGQYVKQRTTSIADKKKTDSTSESLIREMKELAGTGGNQQMQFLQMQLRMMEAQESRNTALITSLIGALGGKTNGGSSASEIVQAVVALKGATDPGTTLFSGMKEMIELFKTLAPGNGGGHEDNVYSVIRDVAPVVADALIAGRSRQQARPNGPPEIREIQAGTAQPVEINAPAPMLTQTQPVPANAPVAQIPTETDMQKQIRLLREAVGFLKQKAIRGKDVNLYIDFVLDEEDEDERMAVLVGAIEHYSFEQLLVNDPEIAGNETIKLWFKEFYAGVKSEISNPANSERSTGDSADVTGHGKVDAASGVTAAD